MYEISIKDVDNKITTYEEKTVYEGLAKYNPGIPKGKILFNVKNKGNNKTKEYFIYVPRARYMFARPQALQLFARNIERSLS